MLLNPMFIERKVNHSTNTVKRWKWEWEYPEGASAKKRYVHKLGEEQPLKPEGKNAWNQAKAICWASGRTLGNIAVFSKSILGSFPAQAGDDDFEAIALLYHEDLGLFPNAEIKGCALSDVRGHDYLR